MVSVLPFVAGYEVPVQTASPSTSRYVYDALHVMQQLMRSLWATLFPGHNNNNNNPICKAPECQKTSVVHMAVRMGFIAVKQIAHCQFTVLRRMSYIGKHR